MTSDESRPSGRTGYTPFEEELVQAMNIFANSADAPRFDAAGIVRTGRRRRATAIAGIAAAVIVIGGGTALAAGVSHGSGVAHTANAASTAPTTKSSDTTVLLGLPDGGSVTIPLGGTNPTTARAELNKAGLHAAFAKAPCDGKPTSVIGVEPHSPTVVHEGATVKVTLCAG